MVNLKSVIFISNNKKLDGLNTDLIESQNHRIIEILSWKGPLDVT